MPSIHQVNHPGKELQISYRNRAKNVLNYYFFNGSTTKGVRLWNRCFINGKQNSHKHKFLEINGKYVDNINIPKEKDGLLRFWGEYEGHSEFELLLKPPNTPYWDSPCAVHRPFFCNQNINDQNTDPYVFGAYFYYAICKKSNLVNLNNGDIILFGSEFGEKGKVKFYLDTLFVAKCSVPSIINPSFDMIYQESTLKRIGLSNCSNGTMPIHIGKKFMDDNNCFSFFPARLNNNENVGFGRPVIDTESLGLRKPGARTGFKSKKLGIDENINSIWKSIANEVLKQGFHLGTHADQLPIYYSLPKKP